MERLALQKVFMQVNECLKWQNCAVSAAAVACRCMSDESLIIYNEIVNLSTFNIRINEIFRMFVDRF